MSIRDQTDAQRERLAYEAARIMLDQGVEDFEKARRKAAERLGVRDRRRWPSNADVQEAILTQRRLFLGPAQHDALRRLRAAAIEAMDLLQDFAPRLIGDALSGAALPTSTVELLLFSERAEDVIFLFLDRHIPWRDGERTLRYPNGERKTFPALHFFAGEVPVELIVMPARAQRNPPLDPVSERPCRGASRSDVADMLEGMRQDSV